MLFIPLADAPTPTGAGAATTAVATVVKHHSHTGWTIGYILFIVVVLVVVALVVPIIGLAGRIGHQAPSINESLQRSQANTANITALETTIDHARVITAGLYRARARLGG